MSRLNYMSEEDEALVALHEDLAVLEKFQAAGGKFNPEQKGEVQALLGRLAVLLGRFDWVDDDEPMPDWLQPLSQVSSPVRRRAAGG